MRLFDAHNHLQDPALAPYWERIAKEVEAAGVKRAVVNGTCEADWERVAELAARYDWILPSYGLHPWYAASRSGDWQSRLEAYLKESRAAVGEIGLDRWIEGYDFEAQLEVFRWQMALAVRLDRPVSLHCLRAWGALWDEVRLGEVPRRGFLVHSYGGPLEMVEGLVKRGAYFSFSGHFLQPRKAERREVFRHIPLKRLLVETDAPDMPLPPELDRHALPQTEGGRALNHPANLGVIYEGLAEIRGCTEEELAAQVAENFERLFER